MVLVQKVDDFRNHCQYLSKWIASWPMPILLKNQILIL